VSDSAPKEYAPGDCLDDRFLLVERLGRGGFGDVWRAEELLPDRTPLRTVALKLLQKNAHDAANWAEEAKLLASFRHPSLVTIYAAGVLSKPEPMPFVAMEILEGRTLADVLSERKRVPWRRVLAWARAVAAALDVIHERYFRNDRSTVPARALEDIFDELRRQRNLQARWIGVNARTMSLPHEPKDDFERQAAQAIRDGKGEYEAVEGTFYRRAQAIPLAAGCLSCHGTFGVDPKTPRFAGLVMKIPLTPPAENR